MPKKKRRKKQEESHLELLFFTEWKARYPTHLPTKEYKFHPTRQFRFDFAWPTKKVALEVHGDGPGHFSLKGMTQDHIKHYEAIILNWRVMYITSTLLSPESLQTTLGQVARLLGIQESTGYIPLRRRR